MTTVPIPVQAFSRIISEMGYIIIFTTHINKGAEEG